MAFSNIAPSFISRLGFSALSVLIALTSGVAFSVRGGTNVNTYIDHKQEVVTCTGTGGKVKYAYCNWQEPQGDAGSGSIVTEVYYSAGKVPKTFVLDGTVGKSATASGSQNIPNFNHINVNSGSTVFFSSGSLLLDSGSYLRLIVPTTNPTLTHTASVMIDYYTRLNSH